jgi:hypothetical protein
VESASASETIALQVQVLVQLIPLGLQGSSNIVWKAGASFGENVSQDLQVSSEMDLQKAHNLVKSFCKYCKTRWNSPVTCPMH